MQKLQIKEEIMAVAALLALGMLTVLAGGLSTKVTTVAEPKATFGVCMALYYATGPVTSRDVVNCGLAGVGVGAGIEGLASRLTGKQSFAISLGTRILNALRVARFGSLGAGLLGFAVIAA
jgi:hypothetical protein